MQNSKKTPLSIAIVMGTRPEAIKLCPVIYEILKRKIIFQPITITTGQHKEMLEQILEEFDIKADYSLDVMEQNQSLALLTEKIIHTLDKLFSKIHPDIILVQGDTTTAFVASLIGYYHKIPVGHIEAGLRTHKKYFPFPEEINRKLISCLATLHFVPTQLSADNLLHEGIASQHIFLTGNTVIDALFYVKRNYSKKWTKFIDKNNKQILVTAHRRENFGSPLINICSAIRRLVEKYDDIEFTYPVHKNPNVREKIFQHLSNIERVNLIEPVNYFDFVALMDASHIILTDSGGIQEEAPSLGKPVLVLRNETERTEAVKAGTVKLIGTNASHIVDETSILLDNPSKYYEMANSINPYGDGRASEKILDILESFPLNNFKKKN